MLPDIKYVADDARKMYKFLKTQICKNLTEITLMCDKKFFDDFVGIPTTDQTLFELLAEHENSNS